MNSVNPPAKHHYIPQFLLAAWATNAGKLWRFLRPFPGKLAVKAVAPAEIGYERHLYATPGLPAEKAQQVEQRFLSPLDTQAAEAHRLLLSGTTLMAQKQRSAWSRFIMSQWFRTPTGLGHFKEAMGLVLTARDEPLNKRYVEVRKPGDPETLEEAIGTLGPAFGGQAAMDLFRKMVDDPKNGKRLNNMRWSVVDTTCGGELLISDAALQQSKAGLFSPQGYLTIPIAPRKLFVAASQPEVLEAVHALSHEDLVARTNRAMVRYASSFVGATDRSQEAFIAENFGRDEHLTLIKGLLDRYRADAGVSGEETST
jgi:hypothetical protein